MSAYTRPEMSELEIVSSPDSPVLLRTRESSLRNSLLVMVSVPLALFTSAEWLLSPAARRRRRRASAAAERTTATPEREREPPGPTDTKGSSVSTSIMARLAPPGARELSEIVMFLLPMRMVPLARKRWLGSSSITCSAESLAKTSDRSSPPCREMCRGARGGRAGGLAGGGNGTVRGGGVGGETVSPPPQAQHISLELKPGMSKVPHV